MGKLLYSKKSLFTANADILVHSCNTQGVWGSGVAKEMQIRYPEAFLKYNHYCRIFDTKEAEDEFLLGKCMTIRGEKETDMQIWNLMVSRDYGKNVDSPQTILIRTVLALGHALKDYKNDGLIIASPKFNSGLFGCDWADVEGILKYFIERYDLQWTVYTNEE